MIRCWFGLHDWRVRADLSMRPDRRPKPIRVCHRCAVTRSLEPHLADYTWDVILWVAAIGGALGILYSVR